MDTSKSKQLALVNIYRIGEQTESQKSYSEEVRHAPTPSKKLWKVLFTFSVKVQ